MDASAAQAVTEACCLLLDAIIQMLHRSPIVDFDQRRALEAKVNLLHGLLGATHPRLLKPIAIPSAPARAMPVVGRNGEEWTIPHKRPRDSLTPSPDLSHKK